MIKHVAEQVKASQASEVILVTSEFSIKEIRSLKLGNVITVLNDDYKRGMTTSIQAGIKAASGDTGGFMICLGDLPAITTEDYDHIISAFQHSLRLDPKVITAPVFNGQQGNPVVFSAIYKTEMLQHPEMGGCKGIVESNREHLSKIPMTDDRILRDIDTPDDYVHPDVNTKSRKS